MPGSVIHDETFDQLGVCVGLVLHLHDFNHVEVDGIPPCVWASLGRLNGQNGIDDVCCEFAGEGGVELGGEGSTRNIDKSRSVQSWGLFKCLEKLAVASV